LQAVNAQNDSHYFGIFGSLALKKLTNGQEVNRPPGPHILVGDEVSWSYVVTNASNITLTEITVVDDQVGTIGCPPFALGPGGAMQCLAGGAAIVGQYHNEATVSGRPPGGPIFAAGAESYYFGAEPSLKLDKRSSGVFIDGAGPFVLVNDPVTWTYMLTNTGNVTLTDIIILDDNGPDDGFLVCEVGTLPPGSQAETCTASGLAVAGPYRNVGAAYGTPPDGLPQIVAEDASSYYGAAPAVALQKLTNGHMAVTPPGPGIVIGQSVTWRYVITNTGNITLTALTVSDDNGSPADNSDDITVCERTDLGPGDTTYCQLVGTAYLGQYANVGRVVASPLLGDDVMASALSHYVGLRGVFLPLIVR
ncbi:MAG: hypothetical protein ACK2UH_14380, partial [Candidatus Promineifilaceae bacterium]